MGFYNVVIVGLLIYSFFGAALAGIGFGPRWFYTRGSQDGVFDVLGRLRPSIIRS
ncbi:MAG: hypothetical protein KF805_15400 [Phycisphaeraceae bacterium]|nr:hypothetical protein [Phycisphaeraceae bacterium]